MQITYLGGPLAAWWIWLIDIQKVLVCRVQISVVSHIELRWHRFIIPVEIVIENSS